MLKKDTKDLAAYYYQWLNKYKDDADRRKKLLKRVQEYIDWLGDADDTKIFAVESLMEELAKELSDD